MKYLFFLLIPLIIISCKKEEKKLASMDAFQSLENTEIGNLIKTDHQLKKIKKAEITPTVDGEMNDPAWQEVSWNLMDQNWIGDYPNPEDYFGRYKLTWTPEALYVLVEVRDDVLFDQYKDPFTLWWDDDCVEIFIDADNSGGEHQYNNNAFAYHIALDGNVIDLDSNKNPVLLNHHVTTKKATFNNISVWEHEVLIFPDTYTEEQIIDPLVLSSGHKIGFAIAYNDNDGSKERENMMGSVFVPGEDKNQGWINADIFGTLLLVDD